tara:strand:- start:558 stop:1508 length:951 start_codon:yes stop_codon:yes gene_type:complete
MPKTNAVLYNDILADIRYRKDCFNTNPYLHLRTLFKERGYNIVTDRRAGQITTLNKELKEMNKAGKAELEANFKPDEEGTYSLNEKQTKINDILKLSSKQIGEFKEYFLKPQLAEKHFTACDYFFKGEQGIWNKLDEMKEFKAKQCDTKYCKIMYIRKFQGLTGITNKTDLECKNGLDADKAEKVLNEYKTMNGFRDQSKAEWDLTDAYQCSKLLVNMLKQLIPGKGFIDSKKVRVGKETKQKWAINPGFLAHHHRLYKIRTDKRKILRRQILICKVAEEMNYDIGNENENFYSNYAMKFALNCVEIALKRLLQSH